VGTWERKTDSTLSVKIITPTHWILYIESLQGDTHKFGGAIGGTYTLSGNKYMEKINIASFEDYGKAKTDYTTKIDGDKFYLKGTLNWGDGTITHLDEVWQKVNTGKAYPNNPAVGTWNQLSSTYTEADGKTGSHTNATATRFEVISPSHWMRISHRDNKFENAFGGTYTMVGDKLIPVVEFASFPIDKNEKIEISQKVEGEKRYSKGTRTGADGKRIASFEDVFQKENGKAQMAKPGAKKYQSVVKK
jgi:hypothetical protein